MIRFNLFQLAHAYKRFYVACTHISSLILNMTYECHVPNNYLKMSDIRDLAILQLHYQCASIMLWCVQFRMSIRHIKTWVRNSVSKDKLRCCKCNAHCHKAALHRCTVVDAFAARRKNRNILLTRYRLSFASFSCSQFLKQYLTSTDCVLIPSSSFIPCIMTTVVCEAVLVIDILFSRYAFMFLLQISLASTGRFISTS